SEDKMLGLLSMKKPIQTPPAFGHQPAGFHRFAISAATGAGTQFRSVSRHGVIHAFGLRMTGRCIIQIQPARRHTTSSSIQVRPNSENEPRSGWTAGPPLR